MATRSRPIFEEVGTTQKQVATPGGIDARGQGARGAIRIWLMVLFALLAVMIAVGGLTRLTDSGLSITEWAPLSGAVPPLNEADWQAEFEAYQQIPQYQLQNVGMSLAEFQSIYWWEWGHRQLGRVIGLVWAIGFFGFLVARKIPAGWTGRLLFIGALGGLQGAIGWWMVASGLEEGMLSVASYRLATHLGLAFVIFGFITWYILRIGRRSADLLTARRAGDAGLWTLATVLMGLAFLQILLGALVAGIDAGRAYPDWPLMAGGFLPPQMWELQPWWRNLFENNGTVQFMHRMSGYVLFVFAGIVWWRSRRLANRRTRQAFAMMMGMMVVQMALGIWTVMTMAPAHIAILHQFGAVILWVLVMRARFLTRYPLTQSVREARA
ncbi:heme A synthase [Salipiger sp. IMCC34102]|uniref:heme A synthase n=1 Tax=Salipiger sp. IMCC34102 TaxID=2510647 RepID=UPI00101D2C3C|nr:heme A synthase [Salipiger sp. IMCC34102]RYH03115.1 heme A synthase [Salipiger sp. IMCC34102]